MVRLPSLIPGSTTLCSLGRPIPSFPFAHGLSRRCWIDPVCADLSYEEFKSGAASLAAAVKISDGLSTSHGHKELKDLFTRLVRLSLPNLLL